MYHLNEILKSELESCMLHISLFTNASGMFADHVPVTYLRMELDRFQLLIDTVFARIEFAEYVDTYRRELHAARRSLELSDALVNDYYIEEACQLLQQYRNSYFSLSKDRCDFAEILEICSDHLNRLLAKQKYEAMCKEIYINHNLPHLLFGKRNLDVIRYYIEMECFCRSISKQTDIPEEYLQSYYQKWILLYRKYHCRKMFLNYWKVKRKMRK